MSDVLSQQEIDELLRALNSGEVDVDEIQEKSQEKKVRIYDFRRPNKFAKDQLRTLQIIYENFARLLASYLSGILRAYSQVDIASVEPLAYYEFNNSLPEPVILGIVDFKPLKGSMLVAISPNITYAIVDRLLGGPGENYDNVRDFTEIEITLIKKIIMQLLLIMNDSWSNVLKTDFTLEQVETNAQFAQIISPNETVAIITLNVLIGEVEGMVYLCIPHMVIEPIIDQLSTKYWFSTKNVEDLTNEHSDLLINRISTTKLTMKAILGKATITVKDFSNLEIGDVIKLGKKTNDNIGIYVENMKKFDGIVGTVNNSLAVQIINIERGELKSNE